MKSLAWYKTKTGLSAATNLSDAHFAYMKTKSGITNTSLAGHERAVLNGLGYTHPNLDFAKRQFYAAKTGKPLTTDFETLEAAYYANTSLDFV